MTIRAFAVRVRYRLRTRISHVPWLYLRLADLRNRDEDGGSIVTKTTELVVEAFPRSGNTFVTTALRQSQPRRLDIAHHCHAPSQLIKAVRLDKPALLIVRHPRDSILSFILRSPEVDVALGLKSWLHFHRSILPYIGGIEVATFEQVTNDFGAVIDAVNRRFGLSLARFDHNTENVEACFLAIEKRNSRLFGYGEVDESSVGRPSEERKSRKEMLEANWNDPRLHHLRDSALALYEKLRSMAAPPMINQSTTADRECSPHA